MQKMAKYKTPGSKQKYLDNSFMIANNNFTLFSSGIQNNAACADDLLQIFPYILVKSEIDRVQHHINFIKIFQHKFCDESYVFNKISISV
jgi:hypothetical protein